MGQQYRFTNEERNALQEALEAYNAQCTNYLGSSEGAADPGLEALEDCHADLELALSNLKQDILELTGDNAENAAAAIKEAVRVLKDEVGKHPDVAHDPDVALVATMFATAVMAHKTKPILSACNILVSSVRH